MGRLRRSRTHKAQRDIHRASRTRVRFLLTNIKTPDTTPSQARTKDLDQIQLIDLDPKVSCSTPNPGAFPAPSPCSVAHQLPRLRL